MDARVKELKNFLRQARIIRNRLIIRCENFQRHKIEFEEYERRRNEEIEEILFYLELEQYLRD